MCSLEYSDHPWLIGYYRNLILPSQTYFSIQMSSIKEIAQGELYKLETLNGKIAHDLHVISDRYSCWERCTKCVYNHVTSFHVMTIWGLRQPTMLTLWIPTSRQSTRTKLTYKRSHRTSPQNTAPVCIRPQETPTKPPRTQLLSPRTLIWHTSTKLSKDTMSSRGKPGADRAEQNRATLKGLVKLEGNKSCADCKRNKRMWHLAMPSA